MRKYSESIMKIVFLLSAAVSILAVLLYAGSYSPRVFQPSEKLAY